MEVDPASRSQQASSRLKAGQADNLASPLPDSIPVADERPRNGYRYARVPQIRYPSRTPDPAMGIESGRDEGGDTWLAALTAFVALTALSAALAALSALRWFSP